MDLYNPQNLTTRDRMAIVGLVTVATIRVSAVIWVGYWVWKFVVALFYVLIR